MMEAFLLWCIVQDHPITRQRICCCRRSILIATPSVHLRATHHTKANQAPVDGTLLKAAAEYEWLS